jgi:hypothetical protein
MGPADAVAGKIKPQPNSTTPTINEHMVPVNLRDTFPSIRHLLGFFLNGCSVSSSPPFFLSNYAETLHEHGSNPLLFISSIRQVE